MTSVSRSTPPPSPKHRPPAPHTHHAPPPTPSTAHGKHQTPNTPPRLTAPLSPYPANPEPRPASRARFCPDFVPAAPLRPGKRAEPLWRAVGGGRGRVPSNRGPDPEHSKFTPPCAPEPAKFAPPCPHSALLLRLRDRGTPSPQEMGNAALARDGRGIRPGTRCT